MAAPACAKAEPSLETGQIVKGAARSLPVRGKSSNMLPGRNTPVRQKNGPERAVFKEPCRKTAGKGQTTKDCP